MTASTRSNGQALGADAFVHLDVISAFSRLPSPSTPQDDVSALAQQFPLNEQSTQASTREPVAATSDGRDRRRLSLSITPATYAVLEKSCTADCLRGDVGSIQVEVVDLWDSAGAVDCHVRLEGTRPLPRSGMDEHAIRPLLDAFYVRVQVHLDAELARGLDKALDEVRIELLQRAGAAVKTIRKRSQPNGFTGPGLRHRRT